QPAFDVQALTAHKPSDLHHPLDLEPLRHPEVPPDAHHPEHIELLSLQVVLRFGRSLHLDDPARGLPCEFHPSQYRESLSSAPPRERYVPVGLKVAILETGRHFDVTPHLDVAGDGTSADLGMYSDVEIDHLHRPRGG